MSKEDTKIKGKITKRVLKYAVFGGLFYATTMILFEVSQWKYENYSYSIYKFCFEFLWMGLFFGIMAYYNPKTKK